MRRALIAVLLAGAVAVSTTRPAEARWGWGWGWGLGAFAIGALIGAALWRPAYSYYYPAYGYPAYGYGYGYPAYGYGYPSYYYGGYGGYYRPYYGGYYGSYGYRIARLIHLSGYKDTLPVSRRDDARRLSVRSAASFCSRLRVRLIRGYGADHSCIASSRLARSAGSAMTTSSASAANRKAAESGRVIKTIGSPNENIIARRRFSSIIGPRIYPSTMGAGSQSSLSST